MCSEHRSVVAWEGVEGTTMKGEEENLGVKNLFVILIVVILICLNVSNCTL